MAEFQQENAPKPNYRMLSYIKKEGGKEVIMKKLHNEEDIWEAEARFDELRWYGESSLGKHNLDKLRRIKDELTNTIEDLNQWLSKKLLLNQRHRISKIKNKLLDFRWAVIDEIHRREQQQRHLERIEGIMSPRPHTVKAQPPGYGLEAPLKGTPFYKGISPIFAPIPKGKTS